MGLLSLMKEHPGHTKHTIKFKSLIHYKKDTIFFIVVNGNTTCYGNTS